MIDTIEKEDLINQSFEKGEYFKNELIQLQTKHITDIVDIRARGLMIAIELRTIENADFFYNRLIDNGFLVGQKEKTIRFLPPLIIERKNIDDLIKSIDTIITSTS